MKLICMNPAWARGSHTPRAADRTAVTPIWLASGENLPYFRAFAAFSHAPTPDRAAQERRVSRALGQCHRGGETRRWKKSRAGRTCV
jgi:hypothetical protein